MINKLIRKIIFILSLLYATNIFAYDLTPVIKTNSGDIQGKIENNMFFFRGIPYAETPINQRRWMPPMDKEKFGDVFFAGKFGNSCATTNTLGGFGKISYSEDCLYLNIYTPRQMNSKAQLPVLFVIPGGGLQTGSADEYDPSKFIKAGIVVVTINYRVGVFGFFSHPSINKEKKYNVNYGFMDQQKALNWVNSNIEFFGGDKNNITLFGESAGGYSSFAHLFSSLSKDKFQKTIILSGTYHLDQKNLDEANVMGKKVALLLGCTDGNDEEIQRCLRDMPTEKFLNNDIASLSNDQLIIDGQIFKEPFQLSLEQQRFNKVAVVNGFDKNEGTFFAGVVENTAHKKFDEDMYINSFANFYGKGADEITKNKNNNNINNYAEKFSTDMTNYKFACPILSTSASLSKSMPVYGFLFADQSAPQYIKKASIPYRASHTSELQYIFKNFQGANGKYTPLNRRQEKVAKEMMIYFSNFIHSGSPNGKNKNMVKWPLFTEKTRKTIIFSENGTLPAKDVSQTFNCNVTNTHE